jgi:hypothetical protein
MVKILFSFVDIGESFTYRGIDYIKSSKTEAVEYGGSSKLSLKSNTVVEVEFFDEEYDYE